VKKLTLSIAAVSLLIVSPLAWGQQAAPQQASQTHAAKVGLIDMARVFREYTKFSVLREDLKAEIQKADQQAKAMAVKIQKLQEEMKQFKPDSPEYTKREKELTRLTTEFETFRKTKQREFVRKEADIYKTIYLEVVDVVRKYAEYYNYTLVLRFNGDKLDTDNPEKLIRGMNRQVVYYRAEDDITPAIIDYLNRRYEQAKAGGATTTK